VLNTCALLSLISPNGQEIIMGKYETAAMASIGSGIGLGIMIGLINGLSTYLLSDGQTLEEWATTTASGGA
tara:strand:+ start:215 stop:427 length:213 start_codon:yes stop_codon:yes gene_type:complete